MSVEIRIETLEHHPLAGRDWPEQGELLCEECAGIDVGQQTGGFNDGLGCCGDVLDR